MMNKKKRIKELKKEGWVKKYRAVRDCFQKSDVIRAKHLLYQDFLKERTDINKFIFYLWLDKNELKAEYGYDAVDGSFGFALVFVPQKIVNL